QRLSSAMFSELSSADFALRSKISHDRKFPLSSGDRVFGARLGLWSTMLKTIGQKISRIGDVIQDPRLLALRLRGIEVRAFEALNKPWLVNSGIRTVVDVG